MLTDKYGRSIEYLRLAVTDRCNLRCTYCMPVKGLDWLPRTELMTNAEMLRLCILMAELGVKKIRITGGEPFMRKDLIPFLEDLVRVKGLETITMTTNGVLTSKFIPDLVRLGIKKVNLSIDTLDRQRFIEIAHRDELDKVLATFDALLKYGIKTKLNTVVMSDKNIIDLIPLIMFSKKLPVSVRFIEEMPFNGGGHKVAKPWNYKKILEHVKETFPDIEKLPDPPHSTSLNYQIPGFRGSFGIIAAYSRLFCEECDRIRIDSNGGLRTCLYAESKINFKKAMRNGASDQEIRQMIIDAVHQKPKDGFEAEKKRKAENNPPKESMATIGG